MFDNLKALSQLGPMMAKARDMQQKMEEVQARLPALRGEGSAGGGLVTAVVNGNMELVNLSYNTSAPLTDAELLADLTRAAVNQAMKDVKEKVQREMKQVTGDIDVSAFQNLLGR